jgi:Response regulator receiver domain
VLEVSMPRMTGLPAARELSRQRPELRIVMLSMHDKEQYFFEPLKVGAAGYVLKSAANRDLIEACRAAMRGEPSSIRAPGAHHGAEWRVSCAARVPVPAKVEPLRDRLRSSCESPDRKRAMRNLSWVCAAVAAALLGGAAASLGSPSGDRDADLPQAGVFLEGIGVDTRAGVYYVSATNQSGALYRGSTRAGDQVLELWQPPRAGDNGRGIDVDRTGRVYVAGGPAAEVRVFARDGELLAELPTGAPGRSSTMSGWARTAPPT